MSVFEEKDELNPKAMHKESRVVTMAKQHQRRNEQRLRHADLNTTFSARHTHCTRCKGWEHVCAIE
jgi:hypothetical protein